jgi:hypothetical protein
MPIIDRRPGPHSVLEAFKDSGDDMHFSSEVHKGLTCLYGAPQCHQMPARRIKM